MYKKSFFRGLGTGLIVGALTVTVAFNFDNAGKNDSGQGNTANIVQQNTTEKASEADSNTTEKSTTEKATTEKAVKDKDTTEKVTTEKAGNDKTSDVNGKGDVYADGSKADNNGGSGSSTGSNGGSGSSTDSNGGSANSSGSDSNSSSSGSKNNNSGSGNSSNADSNGGLSDNTQKVPSSKDNGYTEDKNSSSGSGSNSNNTTEATTEAVKASAIKYDNGGGQITFGADTSAYEICQLLAQIGIRDADEYYDWLLRSGYSESLVPGTYTFSGNETNGGIVWILLGNQ